MGSTDEADYMTMSRRSSNERDEADYMTMSRRSSNERDEPDYAIMNRPSSNEKASETMQNDVVQILYEYDGADIADMVDQTLSKDALGITVFKDILTRPKDGRLTGISATVNIIVMTPDLLKALAENDEGYFEDIFMSGTKTIMMVPDKFDIDKSKSVLAEKYKMSSKWQMTHIGGSEISFKRSILDVLELLELAEQRNSAPTLKLCSIVPHTISSVRDSVYVVFRSDVPVQVTVTALDELGGCNVTFNTTRINASMFSFKPKGLTHGEKKMEVKVGKICAGICSVIIKSQMEVYSDLIADVINPVSFMCDMMGVSEKKKEALDSDFVDRLSNGHCSDPMNNLLTGNYNNEDCQSRSVKMYPTLLHFAAHYGLPGLCKLLLTYPAAALAKRLRNRDGRTPYDLAKQVDERYLATLLLDNDCVVERRLSKSPRASGAYSLPNDVGTDLANEPTSTTPLPHRVRSTSERRSASEQIWSHRMTVVYEDHTTPRLEQLSSGTGNITDLLTYHF